MSESTYICCRHKRFVRLRIVSETSIFGGKYIDTSKPKCVTLVESKLWSNGQVIRYCFVLPDDSGGKLKPMQYPPLAGSSHENGVRLVMQAMTIFEKYANVKFERMDNPDEAEIRIRFDDSELWTTIGTDALLVSEKEATLNIRFIKDSEDDSSPGEAKNPEKKIEEETANLAIALHIIGHVLGLSHEISSSVPPRTIPPGTRESIVNNYFRDAHDERPMTNFKEVKSDSIMAHLCYKTAGTDSQPNFNKTLSDDDRAWLAFHYPKPEFPAGRVDADTWGFQRSLGQLLGGPSSYYESIVSSGDVFERRSLYAEFLHHQWQGEQDKRKRISDAALSEALKDSAQAAVTNIKNPERMGELVRFGDRFSRKLQAYTVKQAAPNRMPDGEEINPVEIQQGISQLLNLLGVSAPQEVQHALTHIPEKERDQPSLAAIDARKRELQAQITSLEGEIEDAKEVKGAQARLEKAKKGDSSNDAEGKAFQDLITKTVELERKKDQIKSLKERIQELEKQEEEKKLQSRMAQAGLDELVRHAEQNAEGSGVTGAEIQQFLSWIPSIIGGLGKVAGTLLGFSIDIDGTVQRPEGAQEGIWSMLKKIPITEIVKTGVNIYEKVTS